jgi:hypothetical protein
LEKIIIGFFFGEWWHKWFAPIFFFDFQIEMMLRNLFNKYAFVLSELYSAW